MHYFLHICQVLAATLQIIQVTLSRFFLIFGQNYIKQAVVTICFKVRNISTEVCMTVVAMLTSGGGIIDHLFVTHNYIECN